MFKKLARVYSSTKATFADLWRQFQERPSIPADSPILFKYSLQGLFAVRDYIALFFVERREKNKNRPSVNLECAHETYRASEFACLYGKQGNACMRILSKKLERKGIVPRSQLRALIHNYVLRPCPSGGVRLKASLFWAVYMTIFLLLLAAYTAVLSITVLFTTLSLLQSAGVILLILLISGSSGYCFYYCAIKPYAIYRKYGSEIMSFADRLCTNQESSRHLRLV